MIKKGIVERVIDMEYTLMKNADRELIYYGIYHTEIEVPDGDLLSEVRKKYFESGKKQKNRSTYNIMGELYRSSYSMEEGKPLKWKKLIGSQLSERVTIKNDHYFVETLDRDRKPYKRTYFDFEHHWLSTEYYTSGDRKTADYTLVPSVDGNKPVIIRRIGKNIIDMLYPFEQMLDKELTEKLNILTNEPQVFCRTSCGSFYFCTKEEAENRREALEKMLARDNHTIGEPGVDEIIEPAFEVNVSALNDDTEKEEKQEEIVSETNSPVVEEPEKTVLETTEPVKESPSVEPEPVVTEDVTETIPDGEEESITSDEKELTYSAVPTEQDEPEQEKKPLVSDILDDMSEYAVQASPCAFMQDCPYENVDKMIIESGGKQYFYFGDILDDKRNGSGRTSMSDGKTAYEGSYRGDKRDGFGVYYYKSGKLCYAGSWKQNRRSGLGVAFSPNDGSAYIGKWQDNVSTGVGASFDSEGRLVYLGKTVDGKRSGAGVTYSAERDTFFVGKYKDGEFLEKGTQFDKEGNLLYVGGYVNGVRTGEGTSYNHDGTIHYKGMWKDNLFHGEGVLYIEDGSILKGSFRNGSAYGSCTLTDSSGRVIYTGGFDNDLYNGTGRLYSDDGGVVEGRFVDGEPTGIFNEYNGNGDLVYCGEWTDMHRNGRGIEYKNGEKLYEGDFINSVYHGSGKLYENGSLVYTGGFDNGIKSGFGMEICEEEVVYQGMWEQDTYNGCGILYEEGYPKYAGCFENGRKQGRINEIADNHIVKKCIYKDDELIYMCEYSDDGTLLYYGSVKDGERSGMGCSFNSSCEKEYEGIFKSGKLEKPMQVFFKDLEDIPSCSELSDSDYDLFIHSPEYAVETNTADGIYTGQLRDSKPEGKGTILYFDHRYTGQFHSGKPEGSGVIYMRDGSEIKGIFSTEPTPSGETLIFTNVTYYRN